MATLDTTLSGLKFANTSNFTRNFGTKKTSTQNGGSLTTNELNENMAKIFDTQKAFVVTESSSTKTIEFDATFIVNAAVSLTLGAPLSDGISVTVWGAAGAIIKTASSTLLTFPTTSFCTLIARNGTWTHQQFLQGPTINSPTINSPTINSPTIKDLANFSSITNTVKAYVPKDFVYVQLPMMKAPSELFVGTWSDVSSKYKGLFFRVAGGDAAPFNKTLSVASQSGTTLTFASGHGIIKGYMLINTANGEQRNVTAVSGNTITLNSAFSTTLTTVLIVQAEGVPNITGEAWIRVREGSATADSIEQTTGAFTRGGSRTFERATAVKDDSETKSLKIDASLSNSIYGSSTHVTPCNTSIKVWQRVS